MLLFLFACSNIEFSYKQDELNNQLYNNTNIQIAGNELPYLNSIILSKLGMSQKDGFFNRIIAIFKQFFKF